MLTEVEAMTFREWLEYYKIHLRLWLPQLVVNGGLADAECGSTPCEQGAVEEFETMVQPRCSSVPK